MVTGVDGTRSPFGFTEVVPVGLHVDVSFEAHDRSDSGRRPEPPL
jgi:hypothetical protein